MYRGSIPFRVKSWVVLAGALVVAAVLLMSSHERSIAQQPLTQPPAGQTYVGYRVCAPCHFDQYQIWRTTPHAKAFAILPAKYQADASCLKCHSTGFGQPTGFKSLKETPDVAGNTCENCHGPGSEHVKIAKSFGQKKLTKQEDAYVRSTIYKILPKNVCVECHLSVAHKQHPKYDKP
ncbi:MAG TPA: cytochrome c family protein [Lacipirellulaceae bacterium]|nr:cytochrome c family protein [Lacipirellulaceae bacterium]